MLDRSFAAPLAVLALVVFPGCVEEEGVLLEASLTSPALTVEATTLTTEVSGSFGIELALGELAPEATTVKLGTFALKRGDIVLLGPLALTADPKFPLEVGVGKSKHVDVTIQNPEGDPALAIELCSGELRVVGTLTDTLGDDRSVTLESAAFRPSCP
jgi:hypothetical protein